MKNFLAPSMISLALLATACGQSADQKEQSQTAGISDFFRSSSSSFNFNLADYIAKKQSSSPLAAYAKSGSFLLGKKSSLAVENNFVVDGSQSTGKISANYYLKGHALNTSFAVVDAKAISTQRPVGGSYSIRAFGNTVKEGSMSSAFNYQVTRDYTISIPGTALSAVGFYGNAGVGGEISIQGVPAIDTSRQSIQLRLNPAAALYSKLELGASVAAGIAKAGLQGTVRMFEAEEPMYAELGVNSKKQAFGLFKANALEVNAMGGKLEAVATVGVNGLLPAPMQNLWKKYLEKSWKWEVLTIPSTRAASIQGTEASFGSAD
ncbi:MAG: hypothetical protein EOP07_13420 [Proteobacteria bacterium]|nr:MAG: hypothetical protein EOP07_13420 [Pseudomonadota bacterium]